MVSTDKLSLAVLVIMVTWKLDGSDASRILAIFPLPSKSHFTMGEALLRGLATRGHQIDVLSYFPLKNPPPNYRDISLVGTLPSSVNNLTLNKAETYKSLYTTRDMFQTLGNDACNILGLPQIRNIIENRQMNPPYDVAIVEMFAADCFLALGRHFSIPVVGVVTRGLFDWQNGPLGNPHNTAIVPSWFSKFTQRMSFLQRVQNFLITTIRTSEYWFFVPTQLVDVEKYFGIKSLSLLDLHKDVAVVLVNTHPSFDGVRPMTPGIVEVGGLHVVDGVQNFSTNVKKWLDESTEGCVYFSFGSMVKIESFPIETIKVFYKAFERIAPVRVLMKIINEDELPEGLPKNVMTSPWLPQTRVFKETDIDISKKIVKNLPLFISAKHKNVKAFVTHGGLMSIQEAITYGVPMVGVPIFADQHLNARMSAEKEISIMVDYRKITIDTLTEALYRVLKDSAYRDNSKRLSKLFTDRPMSALDTATFWVEYVIRNGNVLRSPSVDLSWWQLEMLDVYAFLIVTALLAVYIAKRSIIFLCNIPYSKCGKLLSARSLGYDFAIISKKVE